MKRIIVLLFPVLVLFSGSCSKSQGPNPVPYAYVNEQLNTNDPLYTNLNTPGLPVYLNAGNKGVVVIQDFSGTFWAFDRTCPYQVNATCGKIVLSTSGLNFVCGSYTAGNKSFDACCDSQWNLDGSISHGPTTYNLKTYHVTATGNIITITN